MSEGIVNLSFMDDGGDDTAPATKRPGILEFYDWVKSTGRCLHTIGWRGVGKNQQRVYCLKPVARVWFLYCHSKQEWYPTCATCENHDEYDIVGIRDREAHPEDPRNHALSVPYLYCGDWTDRNLRNARLDDIPTTYPHDAGPDYTCLAR